VFSDFQYCLLSKYSVLIAIFWSIGTSGWFWGERVRWKRLTVFLFGLVLLILFRISFRVMVEGKKASGVSGMERVGGKMTSLNFRPLP
jgi:hypothetical protein